MDNKILKQLQERYVSCLMMGAEPKMYGNSLESDGRKLKRLLNELVEAGFIAPVSVKGFDTKFGYVMITPAVCKDVEPAAPDLRGYWETRKAEQYNALNHHPGWVRWDSLTVAENLHTFRAPESYHFMWADGFGKNIEWKPGEKLPLETYRSNLWVSIDSLVDEQDERVFNERVESLMRINVAWGLMHIVGCTEDESKAVSTRAHIGAGFRIPRTDEANGPPENTLSAEMQTTADAIAENTVRLERLQAVQRKLAGYGGWDKFMAALRTIVSERAKARDEEASAETH